MSITHRVKRALTAGVAGAMVLSLMPVGVAVAQDADPCDEAPEASFTDEESIAAVHAENVECMAAYGITAGFEDGSFGPGLPTTRQQMASFIARLATQALNGNLEIPADSPAVFDDVDEGNVHFDAINWLADLGITEGVTETEYNPGGNVTRQQMASFIARAHEALGVFDLIETPDTSTVVPFTDIDDASDVHRPNIELLQLVGVIGGFEDGSYRPGDDVTRQQMSRFIVESIRVLDSVGLWNGVFVGVEAPVYTLEVEIDAPETPDSASTFTITTTTSVDDDELSVEGLYVTLAVFGFTTEVGDALDEDGLVDVDAAVASVELPTDADGAAVFEDLGPFPPGEHLLLIWVSEAEGNVDPGAALDVFATPVTISVPEESAVAGLRLVLDPTVVEQNTGTAIGVTVTYLDEDLQPIEAAPVAWAVLDGDANVVAAEGVDGDGALDATAPETDADGVVTGTISNPSGTFDIGEYTVAAWTGPVGTDDLAVADAFDTATFEVVEDAFNALLLTSSSGESDLSFGMDDEVTVQLVDQSDPTDLIVIEAAGIDVRLSFTTPDAEVVVVFATTDASGAAVITIDSPELPDPAADVEYTYTATADRDGDGTFGGIFEVDPLTTTWTNAA